MTNHINAPILNANANVISMASHIKTTSKFTLIPTIRGRGRGLGNLLGVVKKQRIRRQGQIEMLKIIIGLSRKLLKQLEGGDDDADSVFAGESSDDEDDELEDSCDHGWGNL